MIRVILITASFIVVAVAPVLMSDIIFRLNKPNERKKK
jgi:hypothetical protein